MTHLSFIIALGTGAITEKETKAPRVVQKAARLDLSLRLSQAISTRIKELLRGKCLLLPSKMVRINCQLDRI